MNAKKVISENLVAIAYITTIKNLLNLLILPCGLGIRIQPTSALVRVVRVD